MLVCLCACVRMCVCTCVYKCCCLNVVTGCLLVLQGLYQRIKHCRNFPKLKLWSITFYYSNTCFSITLNSTDTLSSQIPTVLVSKAPEPALLSHATVAGLACLSTKPQMSRKPLDISANHSSLNKHFLNDLREKETGDRQTMQPNKAPGP